MDGAGRLEARADWQDLILRSVGEGLIATDLSGIITYWNDGATTLFGFSAAEMLGRPLAALFPEQDPDALSVDLAAGNVNRRTWPGRRKDGTALRVELTTTPLRDVAGAAIGFLTVARDVTESARELEATLEAMADGVIVYDREAQIVRVNAAARTLFALDMQEEYVRLPHAERARLVPVSDADGRPLDLEEFVPERVLRGEVLTGERAVTLRVVSLDGRVSEIEVSGTPLRDAAGEIVGAVVVHRDVTERRRLERQVEDERDLLRAEVAARARVQEELRASEARYRAIAETANEGIWLVDRDGRTLFANARLAAMLGTSVDDLLARGLPDFVFAEDQALARERIRQNLAGMVEQFDFRFRRPDGTAMAVLANTSPVYGEDNTIGGALGMFSDVTERRRAEEALRRQAALLALAHDAIIVRSPDGHIMSWNEGAAALYGWTAVEAVGRTTHDLLRTRVVGTGGAGAETDTAVAERGGWEGELEHTRRDGTWVVVDSRQSLLRGAGGVPEAILEVNRDVRPRRALARLHRVTVALSPAMTTAQVAESIVAQSREALGANGAVVAELSDDGTYLRILRIAGYAPEVVAGWPEFPASLPLPLGEAVRTRDVVLVATPQDHAARYPGRVPVAAEGGSAAWAAIPLLLGERVLGAVGLSFADERPFGEGDGALLRAVGTLCGQALERARLYEAERDSAAQARARSAELQTLLDVLPVGIAIAHDPAAADIRVNPALAVMLGIPPEANASLNLPPEERPATYGVYRQGHELAARELPLDVAAAQGVVIQDMEVGVVHNDGSRLTLLSYAAPLYDEEGRVRGSVGAFLDISERKNFEQAREAFLTAAAHDLRTPLTGLRGHAQLARRRLARVDRPGLAPIAEHLAQIDDATARMAALIDELMDVVRDQTGQRLSLDRRPTDLVALVRGVVAQHSASTEHCLRVETELTALEAHVDAARMERVIGNLLSNAIKFSPEGGDIVVRLGREDGPLGPAVAIAVQDRGLGIPALDLPHVFTRFRRARNVVGQIPGAGIGLAGALQIVSAHGGTIDVQSREGHGSTFMVRLPLVGPRDETVTQQGGDEA
jgi:PAS domain S-box-containing protein